MTRNRLLTYMAASLAAATLLVPATAEAKRKSPLEGKPVVVRKLEHRKLRFTITPMASVSLSQPFVHMGYAGAKLQFYVTDWIGVRGTFQYGVLPRDAKLLNALHADGGLPNGIPAGSPDNPTAAPLRPITEKDNPAPLRHDFDAGLTRNQWLASADVVFTPFAGKLGLFSAIFTEYDIYLFGGLGLSGWNRHYPNQQNTSELLNLGEDCRPTDGSGGAANEECVLHPVVPDTGVKLGPSFGGGLHIFMSDWASLNLEVQDIMSFNNIAGLNRTTTDILDEGRVVVDKNDKNWNHNVTVQLGVKFYLPPKAKRSELKPASK
ncbi:MAG: hypothetical protein H6710_14945 [Myxococcales bacterium]|nr:hypothetical protein [Myxococcales bacterium]MCB9702027.1 hypothetical protein [Myxococcales bacterium]